MEFGEMVLYRIRYLALVQQGLISVISSDLLEVKPKFVILIVGKNSANYNFLRKYSLEHKTS
jgi:hypothetical protein